MSQSMDWWGLDAVDVGVGLGEGTGAEDPHLPGFQLER